MVQRRASASSYMHGSVHLSSQQIPVMHLMRLSCVPEEVAERWR